MNPRSAASPRMRERRGVQSMDVGLRILEVLTAHGGALSLKSISEAVGIAPSNVHRYLASFVHAGLLRQDPDTAHYDLGRLALQVGLAALARHEVLREAPVGLQSIVRESGLVGLILVFGAQGPTIVHLLQTSPPVTLSLGLGSIIPMLRSASGHVFCAFLPEERTRTLIKRELRSNATSSALAASTPRTLGELNALKEKVRRQFHSVVDVDVSPGSRAIASPVLNERAEIIATLSLLGPESRLSGRDSALATLMSTCEQLSRTAGYQGRWVERNDKSRSGQ